MDNNETLYEIQNEEAVRQVCSSLPPAGVIEHLADFYKVMGDQTRLKLLMALEVQELCVSDLASITGMTRSAVSHQLKTLRSAKLIRSRKDGKAVYYSLDDEHIHSVIKVALAHLLEDEH